jgi:hypothetical protein
MKRLKPWLALLHPGDWLVLLSGLAVCAVSFPLAWQGGPPERAVIRRDGALFAELPLTQPRQLKVDGAMGVTVIEIQPGRARVVSDPGPRQYCVRQGWLTRPNAIAICAPNHVSLALSGGNKSHDTLAY